MDVLGVFSHEGWHQYLHWACSSQIPFPAWLDEGIGDYFYPAYFDEKEVILGAPMDDRLPTIQHAILKDRHVPFEKFVLYAQRDYYANAGQNYAQGWSMVHFFMEHPLHRERDYVRRYLKIFLDLHSMEKTVPRVFGKDPDWAAIEADWKDWILSIPQEIDPDDPFVEKAVAANETIALRREGLAPEIRKALDACIAKRRNHPAGIEPTEK
ncbi:MAG: DUF1570 domain-containing protein, partial [Planctomycetes bacterium]|nr:DUF1570 domain-containing protein [Planctomycetota bacterium]